jgi:hypothetical protein
MSMATALVIAAALLAGAIMADRAFSQATTAAPVVAYVVATCGTAPTVPAASGWHYAAGFWAPLTMNPGGAICVNQ